MSGPLARELARRLLVLEAARDEPAVAGGSEWVRVCGRLRLPLSKLAGDAGFRSLLSRALTLAKAEAPALEAIRVLPDGSLEGIDGMEPNGDTGAGVVVVAQLLGLLVTFIGEPLTLSLVRGTWPDVSVTGLDAGRGREDERS